MPEHAATVTELDQKERAALNFFREYEEDVQHILRNPRLLADTEESGCFEVFIGHLDHALATSALSREGLLFHGMNRDIAHNFLFMLDVKETGGEGGVFTGLIPHLIRDPGYTLFSPDPDVVLRKLPGVEQETRVIVAYMSHPDDPAVVLDEQVLYPRNATWVTTGATTVRWDGTPVVIIGIEMAGSGEA
ncbi:MAG: hypothetical protein GKC06_04245 [Methanomicrobiales archaeon]|nr:hypothetical protein [Methanomicrobiales archaeon]